MELRKSGKVAVGIIAALGTIGALHWFVFKDKAEAYQRERAQYQNVVQRFASQGNAPRVDDINRFRYETLRYKLQYWEKVQELGFYFPNYYRDFAAVDDRLQHAELWESLRELQQRRVAAEAGDGPRLTFLEGRRWGWNTGLPPALVQAGIAVEDVMTQIRNEDRLLRSLDPNSPAYVQHTQIYANLLARVGVSETERDRISREYGPVAATFYTLFRIQEVKAALPADFFPPTTTEDARLREMYNLFRVQWPKDANGTIAFPQYTVQARELVNMIDVAKKHGIQEIGWVRMNMLREVRWTDPAEEEAKEAEAPAASFVDMDFMMFDEFGMMDEFGGGGGRGGAAGGRFGGLAAPEPEGELVAVAVPIEIMTVGDNASTMSFLYEVSNSNRPLELDALRMRSPAQPNAPIQALAYFNVIGYATLAGLSIEEQVANTVTQLRRDMYELSTRVGARELAVEDGIVRQDGGSYVLIPAMPAPAPGTAPTGAVQPMGDPMMMEDMGGGEALR